MPYLTDCPCCGDYIAFGDQERHHAMTILIDPDTGLPPGVDPDTGQRHTPPPAALRRAQPRPLCPACHTHWSNTRELNFTAPRIGSPVPRVITGSGTLPDPRPYPVRFECPDQACGRIVRAVNGRIEEHRSRDDNGLRCGCSNARLDRFTTT